MDNDKKIDSLKKQIEILKGVAIFLALFIVVIFIIVIIVLSYYLYQLAQLLVGTFYNFNECSTDPSKCNYINTNAEIPIPPFTNTNFKDISLFCAQILLNLEEYIKNDNNLNVPRQMIFIAFITGCPNCKPPYGLSVNEVDIPMGYCLLDPANNTFYICFRGAVTARDWQGSFLTTQSSFSFSIKIGSVIPILPICPISDIEIHSGFLTLYGTVSDIVNNIVLTNINLFDNLVITGHSLGGALASICAFNLSTLLPDKNIYVYTFGKPRVGNISYAECVNSIFGDNFHRLTNIDDVICDLPFATMPNPSNYNQPYLYQHEGILNPYQINWGSQTLNHSLNNYMSWIQTL